MVPLRDERGCSGPTVSTADAQRPLSRQISRCAAHAFFAENLRNAKPSSARSVVCTMLMWMWRMRVKINIAARGADARGCRARQGPLCRSWRRQIWIIGSAHPIPDRGLVLANPALPNTCDAGTKVAAYRKEPCSVAACAPIWVVAVSDRAAASRPSKTSGLWHNWENL